MQADPFLGQVNTGIGIGCEGRFDLTCEVRLEVFEQLGRRAELAVQRRPGDHGRPLQAVQPVG